MLEISISPLDVSAIDIPAVKEELSIMQKELSNASTSIFDFKDISGNLKHIIRTSKFLDQTDHELEAVNKLKRSADRLEAALSEVQEMMDSLEAVLRKSKAIVPPILSTPDDITVAFHMAVNSPVINWHFAEIVLERHLFLWTTEESAMVGDRKSYFRENVWQMNGFERNMVRLLGGGDRWRLRKTSEVLSKLIDNDRDCDVVVNDKFFNSLASIILQPDQSSALTGESRWTYLITNDQNKPIDRGISRLINSFLYSKRGNTNIVFNLLNLMSALVLRDSSPERNSLHLSIAPDIPKAMIKILCEEKENTDAIEICLALIYRTLSFEGKRDFQDCAVLGETYINSGICAVLIPIFDMYKFAMSKMENAIRIISIIIDFAELITEGHMYTRLFIDAGLMQPLVQVINSSQVLNSSYNFVHISDLVRILIDCGGKDGKVIEEFHDLGINIRSRFWRKELLDSRSRAEEEE